MLRPPVGVALLGFVALMAGFAFLIVGFRYAGYLVFGRGDLGDGLFLWGILAIISGLLFVGAAFRFGLPNRGDGSLPTPLRSSASSGPSS